MVKFIITNELGRLAKWLRIVGYDAEYFAGDNHSSLFIQALRDGRIILTRNQHLPKRTGIKILLINSGAIKEQIAEVVKMLKLCVNKDIMFTRCILCNALLEQIEKIKIQDKVPEYVFATQDNFITCPKCKRVYWQGTHWGNVSKILEEINKSNQKSE